MGLIRVLMVRLWALAAALMVAICSGKVSRELQICAPPGEVMKMRSEYLAANSMLAGEPVALTGTGRP